MIEFSIFLLFIPCRLALANISTLSYDNFFSRLKSRDYVLAVAYSESCLYSKAAMPHIMNACQSLSGHYQNFECGKVNVEREKSILPILNISSIPSLLLYERNKLKSKFQGTKSTENIVNWVQNSIVSLPHQISCESLDKREKMGSFNFIIFVEEFDKNLVWKFAQAASNVYDAQIYYSHCTRNIKTGFPAMAALSNIDEKIVWYNNADFREDKITKFMFDFRFSEITMHKEPLFYSLLLNNEAIMVLFLTNEAENSEITENYKRASSILLNKIRMTIAFPAKDHNSRKLSNMLDQPNPQKPFIAIFSKGEENELAKYLLNEENPDLDGILRFFMQFSEKGIEQYYRSQRLKSPIKWKSDNLARATGIGFDQLMKTDGKDFLILFCSKERKVCSKAFDVIEDLAYELEHLKDLKFITIESQKNEVPGPPIFQVPHFRFYRKDAREAPVFYDKSTLTIESLRDFVRDYISVLDEAKNGKQVGRDEL